MLLESASRSFASPGCLGSRRSREREAINQPSGAYTSRLTGLACRFKTTSRFPYGLSFSIAETIFRSLIVVYSSGPLSKTVAVPSWLTEAR